MMNQEDLMKSYEEFVGLRDVLKIAVLSAARTNDVAIKAQGIIIPAKELGHLVEGQNVEFPDNQYYLTSSFFVNDKTEHIDLDKVGDYVSLQRLIDHYAPKIEVIEQMRQDFQIRKKLLLETYSEVFSEDDELFLI